MHGYQIRQDALRDQTESWTDVKPGSLYSALHRMAIEGLVEVARTEQPETSPQRTIYRITAEGRDEFVAQRDTALRHVAFPPDPLDLALRYVSEMTVGQLVEVAQVRHTALVQRLAVHEAAYANSKTYLVGLEPITFRHVLQRLRTEVQWHEQLLTELHAVPGGTAISSADKSVSHTTEQV